MPCDPFARNTTATSSAGVARPRHRLGRSTSSVRQEALQSVFWRSQILLSFVPRSEVVSQVVVQQWGQLVGSEHRSHEVNDRKQFLAVSTLQRSFDVYFRTLPRVLCWGSPQEHEIELQVKEQGRRLRYRTLLQARESRQNM